MEANEPWPADTVLDAVAKRVPENVWKESNVISDIECDAGLA